MTDVHTGYELAIQDRVLVEADIHGRPVSFRTLIVKICPDELWLGLASPDRRLETIRSNQTIRLTVARAGGALVGQSGFLRPLGGSKSRVFAVVRPGALERVQRRAHIRHQVDLPIHFRHIDTASREPRGKAAGGMTINLSPGGLLFESDVPLSVGEELDLTLPLSGEDRVSILGVVTRVRGPEEGALGPTDRPGRPEVAVRFTRITAVDQDRIVRFVLLMEHRRREAASWQPQAPAAIPASAPQPAPQAPVAVPASAPRPAPQAVPFADPGPAAPRAVAPPQPVPIVAPEPVLGPQAASSAAPQKPEPNQPLIAVGLRLCESAESVDVRLWFDGLMPGSRIELLTLLQANIAGGSVPGAQEPGSARPLAQALGLLAA